MLLYLHIPFCHRVCPYCSFYKHTPGSTPIGGFVDAIIAETRLRVPAAPAAPHTLYLGGGTPSMLSPAHLTRLFRALQEIVDFSSLEEVTLEANPATFDLKKAVLFRSLGVTRVSLGIQSFSPHVLQTLGREHTPQQASEAVAILRRADLPSINIDLMFSIPGQSLEDWEQTLRHTLDLAPDHVSAYNLTYEEDTAFFESLRRGEMSRSEDHDADHFHLASRLLTAAGYDHYETSNYARPGHHSRHNRGYWNGLDYLGLGPSAVSTLGGIRSRNVSDTTAYIARVAKLGHAFDESESLDPEARRIERIALGLRTSEGIPLDLLDEAGGNKARALAAEGLATLTPTHFILVRNGRALVDPIAAELI